MQKTSEQFFRNLINTAENSFPSENASTRRYEAERIIAHVLNIQRIDIYTQNNLFITDKQKKQIKFFFQRRINNEPLQYILGFEYFRDLKLTVGLGVLIPRPETELIVEKTLKLLASSQQHEVNILDIGTGSGAIALAIAYESPSSIVTAVDISDEALRYAKLNASQNNISNITIFKNNLCKGFKNSSFNIITANLPYVTDDEYNYLDLEVKNFEPKMALTSGYDGLDLIRELIPQALYILKPQGWILLEIGYQQGKAVADLLKKNCFSNIEVMTDFNQRDRVVIGQKLLYS